MAKKPSDFGPSVDCAGAVWEFSCLIGLESDHSESKRILLYFRSGSEVQS